MEPASSKYRYEPQPDITAWELAKMIGVLVMKFPSAAALDAHVEALPPECRRHLVEVKVANRAESDPH